MKDEFPGYFKFHRKSQLDKSINTLLGLIEGISIDRAINETELSFLMRWLREHQDMRGRHPYNELMPVISQAVDRGILLAGEYDDVKWLCEKLCSTEYADKTTADLQRLHALVAGIISDGVVSGDELLGLKEWLNDHEHLSTCWPYDEIYSLVLVVSKDGVIDAREQKMLLAFFSEFIAILDDRTITNPLVEEGGALVGLCAVCPEIRFTDSVFCFTGASSRFSRNGFHELVANLGGRVSDTVSGKVHYLIIGADGNPCWAYSCYGRKVEKAVELRKAGARLVIVHEHDFHDAVQDAVS